MSQDPTEDIKPAADTTGAAPNDPSTGASPADAALLLAAARAEVEKMKDAHLRALADIENIRRRAQRDIDDARKFALQRFAEDLLPVLDDIASGLAVADKAVDVKSVAEGLRMTGDRLKTALAKNGLVEVHPLGATFDPHAHEAVAHIPHDTVPEDHVVEVYRAGFKLHDRVIRPATVTVSSGPAA